MTTTEPTAQEQAYGLREDLEQHLDRMDRLYGLDRCHDAAEALDEELRERPLSIDTQITLNVTDQVTVISLTDDEEEARQAVIEACNTPLDPREYRSRVHLMLTQAVPGHENEHHDVLTEELVRA